MSKKELCAGIGRENAKVFERYYRAVQIHLGYAGSLIVSQRHMLKNIINHYSRGRGKIVKCTRGIFQVSVQTSRTCPRRSRNRNPKMRPMCVRIATRRTIPLNDWLKSGNIGRIDPPFDSKSISGTDIQIRTRWHSDCSIDSVKRKSLPNFSGSISGSALKSSVVSAYNICRTGFSRPPTHDVISALGFAISKPKPIGLPGHGDKSALDRSRPQRERVRTEVR